MKILLAPNALKGSLSAADFAKAAEQVLKKKHHVRRICLSDGGDGFLDFFQTLFPAAKRKYVPARNAFLKQKRVPFLWLPDRKTAVLETAKICGLGNLSQQELDIMHASSYGVGEVILKAVATGAKTIYIGLGGVACSDGGAGMLQACGAALFDKKENSLPQGAEPLLHLHRADFSALSKKLKGVKIFGVCDVTNPLLGPKSSAKVFGPQKGASPAQVKLLDKALTTWARAIQKETGRRISDGKGTAAAGAIAAGLVGGFGAQLIGGAQFLTQKTQLEKWICKADLVITSEGKLDRQTFYGKAPLTILELAKKHRKPVLFICGQADEKALKNQPFAPQQLAVLTDFATNEQDAKTHASKYLRRILKNI